MRAFDVLVDARFVPMDLALDTIEAEHKRDSAAASGRTVLQWIDVLRSASGVDWANIEKASLPWQSPWEASFGTEIRLWYNYTEGVVTGPCKVFFGKKSLPGDHYPAWLHAYYVLKAERRGNARVVDYCWNRLKRYVEEVPGYDLTSAFDCYVILVAAVRNIVGAPLAGYENLPLSRPIALAGCTLKREGAAQ